MNTKPAGLVCLIKDTARSVDCTRDAMSIAGFTNTKTPKVGSTIQFLDVSGLKMAARGHIPQVNQ